MRHRGGTGQGGTRRLVWFTLLMLLMEGCSTVAAPDPDCAGQRVILTLAQGMDGGRPEFVRDLSRGAGVPVNYMRRLFEDHYLYCLATDGSRETLDGVLERLEAQPQVLQVEIDRIHTPQETP